VNCTGCGTEIRRGEEYVALNRHIEVLGRRFYERQDSVTVMDAEGLANYHLRCEPPNAGRS
jgi:hypothetical protein